MKTWVPFVRVAGAALAAFSQVQASLRMPEELSLPGSHSGLARSALAEKHTLFEVVTRAEEAGGTPVGAGLFDEEGWHLAVVDVAYAEDAGEEYRCEVIKADVTEKTLKLLARPCVFRGEIRRVQNEQTALHLVNLRLSTAIALVECISGGEVRSVRPLTRGSETLFMAMVRNSEGKMVAAVLDPSTSTLRGSSYP